MQDLRLIGVHEDGQHLLLSDADGSRYRLTLDEALRAAARRDRPRLGQLQIEIEGGLRPRDVQSLIRRGLSTEEVADRAGWTVEKVRRFEGPVLAEREHVARIAQQCAVGSRGNGPVTLAERVAERLRDRGVERDDAEWDSARDEEGTWSLTMTFPAGGRQRTATWRYEPLGGSVAASNDEARWLSEEAAAGAIPTPHRAPTSGDLDVYDIDADGGVERAARERAPHEPIDLMAAMREHSARGRRSRRRPSPSQTPGEDLPRADALPLEDLAIDPADVPPPPASRGRNRGAGPPRGAHDVRRGGRRLARGVRGTGRARRRSRRRHRALRRGGRRMPVPPTPTRPPRRATGRPATVDDGQTRPSPRRHPADPPRHARDARACRAGTTSSSAPAAAAPPDPLGHSPLLTRRGQPDSVTGGAAPRRRRGRRAACPATARPPGPRGCSSGACSAGGTAPRTPRAPSSRPRCRRRRPARPRRP